MRLRSTHAAATIAAILALTACSSATPGSAPVAATAASPSSSSSSPTPTPTPTPTELGEVQRLDQLRDAAVAAGYPCPSWGETNSINEASETGTCSNSDRLSTYTSEASRDAVVDTLQSGGLSDLSLLVGPNWIIDGKGAPELQPRLGGTVVNSDTPRVHASSEAPEPTATFEGKSADFQIGIKILRKKCFGSAGCNVTYRIEPNYVGLADIPDTGTIEVTYAVKGFEDGEAVHTFTIEGGQASFDSEERGTVASPNSMLSARATDVSYTP